MTKVSKYKETPIVSMMGGYQRFFPLNKNQTPSVHVRSGRNAFTKTPMELFRTRPDPVTNTMGEATTGMIFNSEPVRGFYIGNHIISKQYNIKNVSNAWFLPVVSPASILSLKDSFSSFSFDFFSKSFLVCSSSPASS